jgi:hypothetical protein
MKEEFMIVEFLRTLLYSLTVFSKKYPTVPLTHFLMQYPLAVAEYTLLATNEYAKSKNKKGNKDTAQQLEEKFTEFNLVEYFQFLVSFHSSGLIGSEPHSDWFDPILSCAVRCVAVMSHSEVEGEWAVPPFSSIQLDLSSNVFRHKNKTCHKTDS